MRTPNSEQQLAIAHQGGVVLRAGAGSGKTFVLVEHFIHLMERFLSSAEYTSEQELKTKLRKYLSGLVFMTFTKKAAAELEIRLQERLEDEYERAQTPAWKVVREELSALTIGTIHGFCFKLIAQGFFPGLDPKVSIISEKAQRDRIEELTLAWLSGQEMESTSARQLLLSKRILIRSMVRIFSDPEVRLLWLEDLKARHHLSFMNFLSQLAIELDAEAAMVPVLLESGGAKKIPAYVAVLENYNRFLALGDEAQPSDFEAVFPPRTRLTAPKDNPEVASSIEALAKIRPQLKKYMVSLKAYYEHERESCEEWGQALHSLFSYIEEHYLDIRGITFSDLEYYVLKGLRRGEVAELIARNYHYFVVDEYQDTSEIQFQILRSMVTEDFSRIFCVGDLKQAIYGFRGGDIGVFRKTMERVNLNLDLKLNYRSSSSVIKFNNSLFHHVMPLGPGFSGVDKHAVLFESQDVPPGARKSGSVRKLEMELQRPLEQQDNKRWPGNQELNQCEARAIASEVERLIQIDPRAEIAILYSKLTPSFELINLLMKERRNLKAQVKILSSEDPILSMATLLVEVKEETNIEGLLTLLDAYVKALNFGAKVEECHILQFKTDRTLWGGFEALIRFFWGLGLAHSNFEETYGRLFDLFHQAGAHEEEFLLKLKETSGDRYSIDFQYSGESGQIQIMTTHASKGLEFRHVFLGGIFTNGRKMPSTEGIGMNPGSFKWAPRGVKATTYTTPEFILEAKVDALKNFSESKRLFYVACTRAKESLAWVEMCEEGLCVRAENDSWVHALRSWEESNPETDLIERAKVDHSSFGLARVQALPFFHYDSLGAAEKEGQLAPLVTLTDLSVTRLAALILCPRKFYLKNILKFDLSQEQPFIQADEYKELKLERADEEGELPPRPSSAERGLRLHEIIHDLIKGGNVIPLKTLPEDKSILEKVAARMAPYYREGVELYAETQLKFDFFGHMISGIPDLFILEREKDMVEVWDFKTGIPTEEKDQAYWFQVCAYAHALATRFNVGQVKIALYYIDRDIFKEISLSVEQNDRFLKKVWQRIHNLDQVNPDHCTQCEFGKLCQGEGGRVAPVELSDMI